MITFALSGKPSHAVVAWVDDTHVYVELPCKDAPPFITKYSLTEGGLSSALNLMREIHRKERPTGSRYKIEDHPKLRKIEPKSGSFTEDARAKTRDILKRLKIT